MTTYRDTKGRKLYPVCNWENNQHKLYNANDRAWNRYYEEQTAEAYAVIERVQQALGAFDRYVINGMVYATWEDYKLIKDFVGGYDARHRG